MSFVTKINSALSSYNRRLRALADKQLAASKRRADKKMAAAKTKAGKLQAKAQADRDKARIYRELSEAHQAAKNAAASLKRARIEAGDLTLPERLHRGASDFQRGLRSAHRELYRLQRTPKSRKATAKRTTRRRA